MHGLDHLRRNFRYFLVYRLNRLRLLPERLVPKGYNIHEVIVPRITVFASEAVSKPQALKQPQAWERAEKSCASTPAGAWFPGGLIFWPNTNSLSMR
jgi:hypothetical protein